MAKDTYIRLRCTEEFKIQVETLARKENRPLSNYIENLIKKEIEKMRTWNFKKCTVVEKEFDYDLHQFDVVVNDEVIGTISPNCIEDMESIVADLDKGMEPNGWEDGNGNTIEY